MPEPLEIRMEHRPGRGAMELDAFLATFGQPGDGERIGEIRAELQRRGLLTSAGIDPHLGYIALQEWRTRGASTAPATRSTRRAKASPRPRSLEALLSLGLDSESSGITDAEADLLAQYEHQQYWASRMERNGTSYLRR